jgi:SAM-dependent methyltransferase
METTITNTSGYMRMSAEGQKKVYQDFMLQSIDELRFTKVPEAFDRKYIQAYIDLCRSKKYIKGKILEWGGSEILYSDKEKEDVTICTGMKDVAKEATVQFDILKITTVPKELRHSFDTIICTQVLNYMLDPITALKNMEWLLKPNGRLILTVSGPCYRDRNSEGFKTFWTERGVRDMCKQVFGEDNISDLKVYGTFSGAINSLLGLKADEEINHKKTDFNVITGITCRKA